ncbi:demethoxyubiquinone hydroxylase family protein [Pseudomonas syringae]|uniref:demethoxyubiquinone hydroxylase family protein n=1 Tax=Pseudomonas syringae TaxID=317 RepID=UPI000E31472A|nr:demethoxyubiquinone hydroxylase family protein [Pseudomonas syringae]
MATERQYSPLDRLLLQADSAMRTLLPSSAHSQRPSPAVVQPEHKMSEADTRHVAGLMRINHTGEVCAQALYQGQALTAKLPKVRKAVGEWQSVGLRSQPNIEVIARLKPDLIIADLGRHQALYNDLASLAPTLMLPSRGEDYQGSLKSAELIGVALGKGPQMQARIAENRQHLKTVAEQIPANTNVLFGVAREDSFSVHGPHSYAGSVLQAIGLKVPEVRKNAAPTEFVSLEQLLALDPGWLLVGHYRRPSIVDSWSKQPLWQVLGAVRNKQVAEVDGDSWARNRGIMASEQIADDALAVIKGGKAVLNP